MKLSHFISWDFLPGLFLIFWATGAKATLTVHIIWFHIKNDMTKIENKSLNKPKSFYEWKQSREKFLIFLNGNDTKNNWNIFRFNFSVELKKKLLTFPIKFAQQIFLGLFYDISTEFPIATYASNKNCRNILTNACSILCFLSCLHKFILQKLLAVFLEYVDTYEFQ